MAQQRTKYKITNWKEYNKSLIERGKINIWLDKENLKNWRAEKQKKRGKPKQYSDGLIELCLMVKHLYNLPYRTTEGFIKSVFEQLKIDIEVPSYTQMSRRAAQLSLKLKRVFNHKGPVDVAVDSTGLKVYGEGEWKVRKHGVSKRRTWRKLHIAVDPLDHEIMACVLTDNSSSDDQVFPELFEQVDDVIERCFADGAYDKKGCYKSCHNKQTHLITPPISRARVQKGNLPELFVRDKAIKRIEMLTAQQGTKELARKQWKIEQDYHCRSISETAMFRFKTFFGAKLSSRKIQTQTSEAMIKINLMNKFTAIGMPIPDVTYQ